MLMRVESSAGLRVSEDHRLRVQGRLVFGVVGVDGLAVEDDGDGPPCVEWAYTHRVRSRVHREDPGALSGVLDGARYTSDDLEPASLDGRPSTEDPYRAPAETGEARHVGLVSVPDVVTVCKRKGPTIITATT